jgi:hypothetical protein
MGKEMQRAGKCACGPKLLKTYFLTPAKKIPIKGIPFLLDLIYFLFIGLRCSIQ